jgi:hypothetical protein
MCMFVAAFPNEASMDTYSWQANCSGCMGVAPLHAAFLGPFARGDFSVETQQRSLDIARMLLSSGAMVNAVTGPCNPSFAGVCE